MDKLVVPGQLKMIDCYVLVVTFQPNCLGYNSGWWQEFGGVWVD